MRGEVLYYDEKQGFGFIHGADGVRYTFTAEDMRRAMVLDQGATVEFQPKDGKAREVFSLRTPVSVQSPNRPAGATPTVSGPAVAPAASQHFGRAGAYADDREAMGLWGYFRRGLTERHATFSGRARRKEYWGYVLFWMLALFAICVAGLVADGAAGNLDSNEGPLVTMVATGLFFLATLLPGVAVTVRRLHDMGLSGWFYLLVFLPSIGALIIFVLTLIPSQKRDNKWGPVPQGIRL